MPSTPNSQFTEYVLEQMAGLGGAQAKRMFGGYGIFRAGLMFAVVLDDGLYFKADDLSVERFSSRGLKPFTYEAKGKPVSLHYYQAPPEVLDDPSAMVEWARDAYACAVRNQKPSATKTASATTDGKKRSA